MHFVPAAFTETRDKDLVAFYEPKHSPVSTLIHDVHIDTINNITLLIDYCINCVYYLHIKKKN